VFILGTATTICQDQYNIHFIDSADNRSTLLGYYNTCPESPDGKRIAYVVVDSETDEKGFNGKGSVWLVDRGFTTRKHLTDLGYVQLHNGAFILWVDNRHIAFKDRDTVKVMNVDSEKIIFSRSFSRFGHNAFNGEILLMNNDQESGTEAGLYKYNIYSGETTLLAELTDFYQSRGEVEEFGPISEWRLLHAQWSPNGKRIALRLDVMKSSGNEKDRYLATLNNQGNDIVVFGRKPMHFQWYDDHTIIGHDNQIDDGMPNDKSARRWDYHASLVETIAGPGNHLASFPSKGLFASDSWYHSNPVQLQLYQKGESTPCSVVFRHGFDSIVWKRRAHVNPAFSRDGKRLYFNYALSEELTKAAYIDISGCEPNPGTNPYKY